MRAEHRGQRDRAERQSEILAGRERQTMIFKEGSEGQRNMASETEQNESEKYCRKTEKVKIKERWG